jgi:hypothetical protein
MELNLMRSLLTRHLLRYSVIDVTYLGLWQKSGFRPKWMRDGWLLKKLRPILNVPGSS